MDTESNAGIGLGQKTDEPSHIYVLNTHKPDTLSMFHFNSSEPVEINGTQLVLSKEEEKAARRAKAKERRKIWLASKRDYFREYRRAKRENETPEEKAARAAKEAVRYKRKCDKKMLLQIEATSGGEQSLTAAQRLEEERQRLREKERQARILREARMTPEQKLARNIKMQENYRIKRDRLKTEEPEKAAAIRARINARRRRKRELARDPNKRNKTENKSEYNREYRKRVLMRETPEEKTARLARNCELEKINRIKRQEARRLKRQMELEAKQQKRQQPRPVKTAEEKREQRRKSRAARIAKMTPEQREEERNKQLEWLRRYRERVQKNLSSDQKDGLVKKRTIRNKPCLQPKERNVVLSAQQQQLANNVKIEKDVLQETYVETIGKGQENFHKICEPNDKYKYNKSWSLFEHWKGNESLMQRNFQVKNNILSNMVDDALDSMRRILDARATRDRFAVFGEHIANQIRNSGRNDKEIYIAKQMIDDVITNLQNYNCNDSY